MIHVTVSCCTQPLFNLPYETFTRSAGRHQDLTTIQGYFTACDNQCNELLIGSPVATSGHCSAKVHGPGHVFMCMFEAHPKLDADAACRTPWARLTGCLGDDVGHEKLLALLRVVVVLSAGAHIVRIVHGGWDRYGPRAASIHVAKREGQRLNPVRCEVVLVKENIVVCRLTRAEQSRMTIEVIIKFNWTNNCRVNDSARRAVATAVSIGVGGRKEYDFVILADDDERNFWFEAQFVACSSDAVELLVKDSPEFSFGDPVAIEQKALGKFAHRSPILLKYMHTHCLHVVNKLPVGCLHPDPRNVFRPIAVNTSNDGSE